MPELGRRVKRFRGRLVLKAQRLLYHSTLGLRVIKKNKKKHTTECRNWVDAGTTQQAAKKQSTLLVSVARPTNTSATDFGADLTRKSVTLSIGTPL